MDLNALLKDYKQMVENRIEELFPEADCSYNEVIKAARYSLLNGGKRIRPVIMMEFCKNICLKILKLFFIQYLLAVSSSFLVTVNLKKETI